jgi:uncharacterized protein (TIGR00369 family)
MGIEVVEAAPGRAVIEMDAKPEMTNFAGLVHGGFLSMLADSAMGRALHATLPEGERHVTFDLKMNFISAARPEERLRASANVIHSGRRTALVECRVEGPDGGLLATATGTFSVYLPAAK